ncbi:hypothetical protein CBR_g49624 [Chara braunii]|uniref:HIG1 domain-containing protein n=1 Tax=Chara braunii TaxID=69332 RepID=A0A388M5D8_CHABU|nr:hypothetical protein CBR_g49624 [Chara braunii]|eukprot:GBG89771.1 hypothetical protein CBR_g49624 [Chara braunii]
MGKEGDEGRERRVRKASEGIAVNFWEGDWAGKFSRVLHLSLYFTTSDLGDGKSNVKNAGCVSSLSRLSSTGRARTVMAASAAAAAIGNDMAEDLFGPKKEIRNPLVPIGAMATAGVLIAGLYSFHKGNAARSQNLMRARVVLQGATVALMLGTVTYQQQQKK